MRIIEIRYKMVVLHTRQTAVHTRFRWKSKHIHENVVHIEEIYFDNTVEIKRNKKQ